MLLSRHHPLKAFALFWSLFSTTSLRLSAACETLSSAYNSVSVVKWSGRSFINRRKRTGPSTEPWGTPLLMNSVLHTLTPSTMHWHLFDKYDSNQQRVSPRIPYMANFSRSIPWSTMSKAFFINKKRRLQQYFLYQYCITIHLLISSTQFDTNGFYESLTELRVITCIC